MGTVKTFNCRSLFISFTSFSLRPLDEQREAARPAHFLYAVSVRAHRKPRPTLPQKPIICHFLLVQTFTSSFLSYNTTFLSFYSQLDHSSGTPRHPFLFTFSFTICTICTNSISTAKDFLYLISFFVSYIFSLSHFLDYIHKRLILCHLHHCFSGYTFYLGWCRTSSFIRRQL